ncbi:hypothetical protein DS832_04835 [Bombilactobacillus bombi]|jgi:hypothetical protein|uniref:Uncharacterized protein n=1 Tax=Bombilactobacillus bombi TaxID=1303590 RepID=A0A3R6XRZ3_9LACO|nr:hypothetical protein [Bombilactobacillus bombi]RHW46817.1 hypothetical protein DS832_04835 [Bombilactobacillus bombi]
MTLVEYQLYMEAYQIKQVKLQEQLAMQAWLNQAVQATSGSKKNPKPKYKKFTQFFNSEEEIKKVRDAYEGTNSSHKTKHLTRNQIISKRYEEYQKIKKRKEEENARNI